MTYPIGSAPHAIEIAMGEIGYIETPENITKFGEFTKANGLPWCGSFCNWVLAQAGVKVHSVVSTAIGAHKFKEISRWSFMPSLGALAFMDFPNDSVDRISHVGIVVGFEHGNDTITLIEGNTSGTGDQRNGGMVMVKQRSLKRDIVGFGIPKYVPYKGDYPVIEAEIVKKTTKPKEKKKWSK